jgi:hypothetical protein
VLGKNVLYPRNFIMQNLSLSTDAKSNTFKPFLAFSAIVFYVYFSINNSFSQQSDTGKVYFKRNFEYLDDLSDEIKIEYGIPVTSQ